MLLGWDSFGTILEGYRGKGAVYIPSLWARQARKAIAQRSKTKIIHERTGDQEKIRWMT